MISDIEERRQKERREKKEAARETPATKKREKREGTREKKREGARETSSTSSFRKRVRPMSRARPSASASLSSETPSTSNKLTEEEREYNSLERDDSRHVSLRIVPPRIMPSSTNRCEFLVSSSKLWKVHCWTCTTSAERRWCKASWTLSSLHFQCVLLKTFIGRNTSIIGSLTRFASAVLAPRWVERAYFLSLFPVNGWFLGVGPHWKFEFTQYRKSKVWTVFWFLSTQKSGQRADVYIEIDVYIEGGRTSVFYVCNILNTCTIIKDESTTVLHHNRKNTTT